MFLIRVHVTQMDTKQTILVFGLYKSHMDHQSQNLMTLVAIWFSVGKIDEALNVTYKYFKQDQFTWLANLKKLATGALLLTNGFITSHMKAKVLWSQVI